MATHDYVIANQSGAAFRTDLNNALAAIQSNNSNSSSPATTVSYQWWADTSAAVMKIRNSANDGWIELFQLDGTLTLEDGSASTPALAFRDDLNTGIFSSAADTFDIATAGVSRFQIDASEITFNESGANTDFRIESDSHSHMFFLDAGNNRIGINTDSPTNDLHLISGNTDLVRLECNGTGTTGAVLILFHSTSSPADNDIVGTLSFRGKDDAGNETTYAHIRGIATDVTNGTEDGAIAFGTLKANSFSERMRLDSEGKLGIGTTSPTRLLEVKTDAQNANEILVQIESAAVGSGESTTTLQLHKGNGFGGQISGYLSQGVSSGLTLSTLNGGTVAEVMRVDSNGNLLHQHTGTAASVAEASSGNGGITLGSAGNGIFLGLNSATHGCIFNRISGSGSIISFRFAGADKGSIVVDSSATAYNTSSDYRLKENAVAISDGITRIKTLKPYRFNFKSESSKTVDGFFAHEVTAVPEAITGTKDEVDSDNNPIYQQIDQSKLVPLLVAAVKELITKVEALEAA